MFNEVGPRYKKQIRSRVLSLKEERNAELRTSLLKGTLSVQDFVRTRSEDLASREVEEERRCMSQQNMNDRLLSVDSSSRTGKYVCVRCTGVDTTYTQVQVSLRDDESLMTFVSCNSCGFKWKGEHLEYASPEYEEFQIT